MRPKKTRWVRCEPGERCFRPIGVPLKDLEGVVLTLDEFEALRLLHWEGRDQEDAARLMRVHRSTVSRMLTSANAKLADALVNFRSIRIEGGCCKFVKRRRTGG